MATCAYTVNDSGDTGRVFTVDTATGETVGVTFWADGPDDVEALAPAGPGHVWVGDIGDNSAARDSIEVARVPVGEGDRTVDEETIDLVYPDGARDAEALLVHPVDRAAVVVTKGSSAASSCRATGAGRRRADTLGPRRRGHRHRHRRRVLPRRAHLVLRNYTGAVVYSFPDLEQVGDFDLPVAGAGEGIAAPSDRSSTSAARANGAGAEGAGAGGDPRGALADAPASATASPPTAPTSGAAADGGATSVDNLAEAAADRSVWWWGRAASSPRGGAVLLRSLRPR